VLKRHLTSLAMTSFRMGVLTLGSFGLTALLLAPSVALAASEYEHQVITAFYDDRGSVVGIGQSNCDGSYSMSGIATNNMANVDRSRCDSPTYLVAPTSDYLINHSLAGWCLVTTDPNAGTVEVECHML